MICVTAVQADTLRVATFNSELSRKGPGLLLRDIMRGKDPQIAAVTSILVATDADILTLQGFDYDLENAALSAFSDLLRAKGLSYPHLFSAPPNAGRRTLLDLDGDGIFGGPGDAQGYGRFYGQGSMAILSRYPIEHQQITDFTAFLWRDLPDALLPQTDAGPFPSMKAQTIQRLPSHGAWVVPVIHPTIGKITVLTYHASPPVFDGPEDRNGRRNHDETRFWSLYLDGAFGPSPQSHFILTGDANLDPNRGDGIGTAMQALLSHSKLQDPLPDQPTVTFSQTGPLRVDYALPSSDWTVIDAGIMPPNPGASRHSVVWVDLKP